MNFLCELKLKNEIYLNYYKNQGVKNSIFSPGALNFSELRTKFIKLHFKLAPIKKREANMKNPFQNRFQMFSVAGNILLTPRKGLKSLFSSLTAVCVNKNKLIYCGLVYFFL